MRSKQILIILIALLPLLILSDILVRIFYCSSAHLKFNSQEFNNITSPIVSSLGFIGVIITISLTLNQFKHQQGTNYFNYYRDYIHNIANENSNDKESGHFSTANLLDFPFFHGVSLTI